MLRLNANAWRPAQRYLDHDLWTMRPRRIVNAALVRGLRVVIAVFRASRDPLLNLESMGLVYNTLLSLVPLLAVTFSVLKAFGAHYQMEPVLTQILSPLGPRGVEMSDRVIDFVSRMRVGVLGAVGVAALFYTVLSLIEKIEDALNRIWKVRRSRSLRRKFSDYLSVLLVGPVLIFAAFAIIAAAQSHWLLQRVLEVTRLDVATLGLVRQATPFLFLAGAFTFLYKFLPYTRVRLGAAVVGGLTAAILWQLAGVAFAMLVASSTSYAAVYSSFAVLVLSLIWLHAAWLVALIGGQVAYVHQHPASYLVGRSRRGVSFRERVGLSALVAVTRRHLSATPPYRLEDLAAVIDAPLTTLEELVDDFVAHGIVARAAEPEGTVLARAPEHVPVLEVLDVIQDPTSDRGEAGDTVEALLERRDRAVRDALDGVTLRSLAEDTDTAPPEITDLSRYRRRSGR